MENSTLYKTLYVNKYIIEDTICKQVYYRRHYMENSIL